jgi:hypothetical protein
MTERLLMFFMVRFLRFFSLAAPDFRRGWRTDGCNHQL